MAFSVLLRHSEKNSPVLIDRGQILFLAIDEYRCLLVNKHYNLLSTAKLEREGENDLSMESILVSIRIGLIPRIKSSHCHQRDPHWAALRMTLHEGGWCTLVHTTEYPDLCRPMDSMSNYWRNYFEKIDVPHCSAKTMVEFHLRDHRLDWVETRMNEMLERTTITSNLRYLP